VDNVFLFPGYGAQYVGMGKEFYDRYRIVQELFEEASNCLGINFVRLCFASSERELAEPLNAYLALFVVHAAIFTVLHEHGIKPSVITGWGVGYSSAHYAAGVINFPDGLYLLSKYITFFGELMKGQQVANVRVNGITRDELERYLQDVRLAHAISLGLVRAECDFIVVGVAPAIVRLQEILRKKNIFCAEVPLAYTLHLLCCDEMARRINVYLEKVDCKAPRYQIIDHQGKLIGINEEIVKPALTRFMYEPIDVPRTVQHIQACKKLIQIGPSFLTAKIIKKFLPDVCVKTVQQYKDLKGFGL